MYDVYGSFFYGVQYRYLDRHKKEKKNNNQENLINTSGIKILSRTTSMTYKTITPLCLHKTFCECL